MLETLPFLPPPSLLLSPFFLFSKFCSHCSHYFKWPIPSTLPPNTVGTNTNNTFIARAAASAAKATQEAEEKAKEMRSNEMGEVGDLC
jgi:hypothetical protein